VINFAYSIIDGLIQEAYLKSRT